MQTTTLYYIIVSHLMAVDFHDQRPPPTSASSNSMAGHVTVNRNFTSVSLKQVGCVSSRSVIKA